MNDVALKSPAVSPQAKDAQVNIRASSAEVRAFHDAAELADMSYSAWILKHLRAAATKELRAAGKPVPFEKKR